MSTATQARAKTGGEIAPNGLFYAGGEFIATTEMGRVAKKARKAAQRVADREARALANIAAYEVEKANLLPMLTERYAAQVGQVHPDYRYHAMRELAKRDGLL